MIFLFNDENYFTFHISVTKVWLWIARTSVWSITARVRSEISLDVRKTCARARSMLNLVSCYNESFDFYAQKSVLKTVNFFWQMSRFWCSDRSSSKIDTRARSTIGKWCSSSFDVRKIDVRVFTKVWKTNRGNTIIQFRCYFKYK